MHECPDCYEMCTCGGDIDDMEWESPLDCTHCLGREFMDDEYDDEDWREEEADEA